MPSTYLYNICSLLQCNIFLAFARILLYQQHRTIPHGLSAIHRSARASTFLHAFDREHGVGNGFALPFISYRGNTSHIVITSDFRYAIICHGFDSNRPGGVALTPSGPRHSALVALSAKNQPRSSCAFHAGVSCHQSFFANKVCFLS